MRVKMLGFKSFLLLFVLFISQHGNTQNISRGKKVFSSSKNERYPESLIVDGGISRSSMWVSTDKTLSPHWVILDLVNNYAINQIVLHNGIPEELLTENEKKKGKGYYCIKNFKFQYWDDANWTDFPQSYFTDNDQSRIVLKYNPAIIASKIRLISSDSRPIHVVEIEVFGEEKGISFTTDLSFEKKYENKKNTDKPISWEIFDEIIGKSPKYVGYNQGYFLPGSNNSSWLKYSQVNSLRVWTSLHEYAPAKAFDLNTKLINLEAFEFLKNQLRQDPEFSGLIDWCQIEQIASSKIGSTNTMVFDFVLAESKRLNIDIVLQINSTDFVENWSNKWTQWIRFYAIAFYAAKKGDVQMYAMQNEPNHYSSGMNIDQYISALKISSDAIRSAVLDVNRIFGKNLDCKFVAPVTAGSNTNWWASIIASIKTDYKRNAINYNLFDIFSTHSYNIPAAGYKDKTNDIRSIITQSHPDKKELPIVYTEIGRWMNAYLIDREETMDSPSLFTEWAGIYSKNMNNNIYGMWAFKFSNTKSSTYDRGIKSGHHYTWKGERFIEDAVKNIALNKNVVCNDTMNQSQCFKITDGNKSDQSSWSCFSEKEKIIEINLGEETPLNGVLIYSGSSNGVFTATDRIKKFSLQAWNGTNWFLIPESKEDNSKYAQVLVPFNHTIITSKLRLVVEDIGTVKIREIKLFGNDFLKNKSISYDVSSIQRTGQVVRLFAKGFKNQNSIFKSNVSVEDVELDLDLCFDEKHKCYYAWLVNRNLFDYKLNINFDELNLNPSTPFIIEEVSPLMSGEVKSIKAYSELQRNYHVLPAQSVQLISIPIKAETVLSIPASQTVTVKGGKFKEINFSNEELSICLNSNNFNNNNVSYISFECKNLPITETSKCILELFGNNISDEDLYKIHVYAFKNIKWNQDSLTWENAPFLNKKESLIIDVGGKVEFVGEIFFDKDIRSHQIDISAYMQNDKSDNYTFILIREPREMGDDYDKDKVCNIYINKWHKPTLKIFHHGSVK